ncbi:MAG: Hpt domain-containing protein [Treponemataceae bacterium]|nr:Hpt domain-containing protein [Treponemataceae bacterium]
MDNLKLVNVEEAMARVDNDKELYNDLLTMFFEDPQFKPEDLEKLLAENKIQEAEKLVHLLKGIAGTLGAEKLFSACQSLDDILKGKTEGDIPAGKEAVNTLFLETREELKKVQESL